MTERKITGINVSGGVMTVTLDNGDTLGGVTHIDLVDWVKAIDAQERGPLSVEIRAVMG